MMSDRGEPGRELANPRDHANSLRLVVRTLIAQTVISLVSDGAQSAAAPARRPRRARRQMWPRMTT